MAEGESVLEKTNMRVSDSVARNSLVNVFSDVVKEKNVKKEERIVIDCGKTFLHGGKYESPRDADKNAAMGRICDERAGLRTLSVSLVNISESSQPFTAEQNSRALSMSLPNGLDLRMPSQEYSDLGIVGHYTSSTQRLSDLDTQGHPQLNIQGHSYIDTQRQPAPALSSPDDTSELPRRSLSSTDVQPPVHDSHIPPLHPNEAMPRGQTTQDDSLRRLSVSSLILSQFANKRNRTPSICVHRTSLPREGPPCYSCSTFDLPPKYHKVDEPGWKRAKSRFLCMYRGLVSSGQPGQQSDTSSSPEGEWSSPPYVVATGNHQEPSSYARTSSSEDGSSGEYPTGSLQASVMNNNAFQTLTQRSSVSDIPPPYSPPTPASLMAGQSEIQLMEDQFFALRQPTPMETERVTIGFHQGYCNKSCHCNFIYSLLLAIITSLSLLGPDQPLIILVSAVFFLTVFLYMPIIWALECFLHWRTHGHCRDMRMTGLGTVSPVSVL
ncbi:uncharacterized protein LOC122264372 [Penaeus japonicus]|uniref:uncharacterized protein LOC122264370 n=1 Tax=Penaeus japonicus TaxID=27405 RepID=UPI001C70E5B9|nr:uncharacterized protein LOC122264370 [Penaeus japonicus]XP_042889175.1 uncharacterized protein LOC122264372 [Penaeus japonicus]